jgi:hypothetical protein
MELRFELDQTLAVRRRDVSDDWWASVGEHHPSLAGGDCLEIIETPPRPEAKAITAENALAVEERHLRAVATFWESETIAGPVNGNLACG